MNTTSLNLLDLLRRPEGKTLEFKRDLSSPEGVMRSIVAFANTAGGVLLIGVEDGSQNVCGVSDPIATEERLANLIADHIVPRLVPDIEVIPWRQTHLLALQVYPSATRPHHIKRDGAEKGVYVRVGSSNRKADAELIAELGRFARSENFDEQPIPELDSEALDFRAASEQFAPLRKLTPRDLETLRLLTPHQGRKVPTIGGFLLFGVNRESLFPDAWLQLGRFAGTDKTRIADHADLHGPLIPAIEQAIQFVQRHLNKAAEIGAVRRQDRWDIPPLALREALINAVAHADYAQRGAPIRVSLFDDRLEIENPGLLPFGLTVDDLRQGISKLRNRVIGRVFHELGLIEQWGSGIQRMQAVCRDAGLAPPEFEEIGLRFRVTLRLARIAAPQLDPLDQAILDLLADNTGRTTAELAAHIGRTPRATRTRLAALVERGLLREVGSGPRDPQRRYYRTERA